MNRLRARAGSALLACLLVVAALCPAARADDASSLWFAGTHLILVHAEPNGGDLAVGVHDSGLVNFLARLGATIAWSPGQRYVVITAGDRRTIALTLGDPRIGTANGTVTAPFAPYADGTEAYVPFFALARALYVEPVRQGDEIVMQPQLGVLDVRQDGRKTIVVVHGATPLRFTKTAEAPDRVTLAFGGVASSLGQTRQVGSAALNELDLTVSGNVKNPTSTLTFVGARGSAHALYSSTTANEVTIAFAPAGVALGGLPIPDQAAAGALSLVPAAPVPQMGNAAAPVAPAPVPQAYAPAATAAPNGNAGAVTAVNPNAPPPPPGAGSMTQPYGSAPAPVAPSQPVTVTNVDVLPVDGGVQVRVALSGPAAYEWHRLADGRYYVDCGARRWRPQRATKRASARCNRCACARSGSRRRRSSESRSRSPATTKCNSRRAARRCRSSRSTSPTPTSHTPVRGRSAHRPERRSRRTRIRKPRPHPPPPTTAAAR